MFPSDFFRLMLSRLSFLAKLGSRERLPLSKIRRKGLAQGTVVRMTLRWRTTWPRITAGTRARGQSLLKSETWLKCSRIRSGGRMLFGGFSHWVQHYVVA